ncbi:hypothetical protein CH72_643 [Burkholderia ambifaria AMMD]|uniref:Uncharacterized protein n=1 Tax=Burkholderia ambifaria (strain ATCC BAA-244 / DSM 16087 / CCUG 44356 / LMG 19182 / AMMD) TaxID=339670 RepID=Q0BHB0_BURCM|nr:hypothetical protein [Burkholderia ambifaria]ABI86463.1 hypothetical protein Bamb_0904 [Burkholderia ambifaria AMMD]AJY21584.1 hypothetical protein CH72_643 [Burkholderia ambifaria AMMD]MBR7929920.1 hypothetical protein [Burkholderia ambifaria]PEH67412.1 hypothetical protein CRM91_28710 [Burkholderia ambifaria]QQC03209.1 hypothetical protein I6H84_10485 [Burkholderia ambifaria]
MTERSEKPKAPRGSMFRADVSDNTDEAAEESIQPPAYWSKGALLNVRNRGDAYVVTLYPEEFDERRPERALHFTNLGLCQGFVSRWYSRESHDPRAR